MSGWKWLDPKDRSSARIPTPPELLRALGAWLSEARADLGGKFVRFYAGEFPIYPVALIRIGLGLIVTYRYFLMLPDVSPVFGSEGIIAAVAGEATWVMRNIGPLYGVLLVASVCYLVGAASRISGALVVVCHIALHYTTWSFAWGDGTTGHVFVAYTLLANPGGRLSVDAWLRKRKNPDYVAPETTLALGPRLLMLHIVAIYFMASTNRLLSDGWLHGRMTYVALVHGVFSRMPNWEWQSLKPLLWLATWFTWVIELCAPVFLWRRRTRTLWVLLLMSMHIGLHLTSLIGMWQLNMLTILWIFLPSGWAKQIIQGIEHRIGLFSPRDDATAHRVEAQSAGC